MSIAQGSLLDPDYGPVKRNSCQVSREMEAIARRRVFGPQMQPRCGALDARRYPPRTSMRENIRLFPAGEVECRAGGEEIKTGLGQPSAALARQDLIQRRLELVQIGDVIGGISELTLAQFAGAPVRRLLLL